MSTLLLDIGNSFIESAEWASAGFATRERIPTSALRDHLSRLVPQGTKSIVMSSVVPDADKILSNYVLNKQIQLHAISWQNIPILTLNLSAPEQIGADRLVNALAAYDKVKNHTLIIDCGTATTCCYVDPFGTYQGGAIFPGMRMASQALHDYTAKIPLIFAEPRHALFGKNTVEAVRSGLFHSCVFTLNGFAATMRKHHPDITVIGTGNGLEVLKEHLDLDIFDPHLIFHGLGIVANTLKQSE